MRKIPLIVFATTITIYVATWFTSYRSLLPGYHYFFYTSAKYNALQKQIKSENIFLANHASDNKSRNLFYKNLENCFGNTLLPYWLGTRWNFYGTTQIPGEGTIACGYFVTTFLKHTGAEINRSHLAQLPSEQMIIELVDTKSIYHYNKHVFSAFIESLKSNGNGIYVIGLDNHTGFIEVSDNVYFIHSSGRFPFCVIKELASKSIVLKKSKYKVVGKLTGDDKFISYYTKKALHN